jgi:hypothetical protein
MGIPISLGESSEEFMRRAIAALDEARTKVIAQKRLTISDVATIARKHSIEPVDLLAQLERDRECTVDWQRQEVVCLKM